MVHWIMTCVNSSAFYIFVNGVSHGYFKGGRGLRQGVPMSAYLFTLVMEIFNLIMSKKIEESQRNKYHFGCKEIKLTHLCFADDLLVVCNGDKESLEVVKSALNDFSMVSSLFPNLSKSTIFFGSINKKERSELLKVLPFQCGKLPMKFLGVPILAKRLGIKDCQSLVARVANKVNCWRNKFLSYAGRLQLIASVLASMHKVIKDKESLWVKSIYDATLNSNATVAEMIVDGNWIWPNEWYIKYPILRHIQCPAIIDNIEDKVLWLNRSGAPVPYSTKTMWKDLRGVWPITRWHHVIWFSQLNPKHAFIMWMAIHGKLMTQDRISIWNKDDDLKCPLCKTVVDSHKHLFYECEYSAKVWKDMCKMMKLDRDY
ncbi:RNA-directed DNA polymerase, eukaryota, reverse transcriptase zinc-binding domain protein [Tanacetum coccineum]